MVKLHGKWNDMCCGNCNRKNSQNICDELGQKIQNDQYCKYYIPWDLPPALNQRWEDHMRRFIREQQDMETIDYKTAFFQVYQMLPEPPILDYNVEPDLKRIGDFMRSITNKKIIKTPEV